MAVAGQLLQEFLAETFDDPIIDEHPALVHVVELIEYLVFEYLGQDRDGLVFVLESQ